jgi:hypothetical protein
MQRDPRIGRRDGKEIPERHGAYQPVNRRDCLTAPGKSRYLLARRMLKAAVVLFSVCIPASWVTAETLLLPLMHEPARLVSGAGEFMVRLPRHITIRPGSRLVLVLHLGTLPRERTETLPVMVNNQEVQPRYVAEAGSVALRIEADVPEPLLADGWNSIVAVLPRQFGTCEVRRAESHFSLNYERVPLFPELRRFPESLTEEKLLRPESSTPTLSIFLPAVLRDVHWRACAILGARLGQPGYFTEGDFEIGDINDWPSAENRHAILIGRANELENLPFLSELAPQMSLLAAGRGMLAELVLGNFPDQRRWIVVTGGDDAGLEKALLTLGSRPALNSLAPSPVEIAAVPNVSLETELLARPSRSPPSFKDLGWREVEIGRAPEHRFGWRLPPGYTLRWGRLTLNFFHPKEIASGTLEVSVGGMEIGRVALTPENSDGGSAELLLPEEMGGVDPAMFTFGASTTNTHHRGPIAVVLGNSALETITEPARIAGLEDLITLLLRESFLRRTAFVLPGRASLSETKLLADLAMRLGKQLPSSPVLWPEACTFDAGRHPSLKCVTNRSVVVLAPVSLWAEAVPPKTLLIIKQVGRDTVRIQGRRSHVSDFGPNLTVMQLLPSPWTGGEWLITVGGWQGMDLSTMRHLITVAPGEGKIYGNLAGADGRGRFAAHDSRRPMGEYFAQRLRWQIPRDLTVGQTEDHLKKAAAWRKQSLSINRFLTWSVGILIGLVVLGRLLLVWERGRHYKRTSQQENSLGTIS